jgi:uncharacterized RDD family membrane protein YckC
VTTPTGPAGIVTRCLAAAVDAGVVALAAGVLYLGLAAVRFMWSARTFEWPRPEAAVSVTATAVLAVAYLTLAWATTGRTYGAAVLGVRVLSAKHAVLGWFRAAVRAVLCVVFPIGLLWSVVSRRRGSLQDLVVRSVVVYDWHLDGGARATAE